MTIHIRHENDEPIEVRQWTFTLEPKKVVEEGEEFDDASVTMQLRSEDDNDLLVEFDTEGAAFEFAMGIIEALDSTFKDAARDSWNLGVG